MRTNKLPTIGGINEVASALGTTPDKLTRAKQHGDFIDPIGTVSGRDAYDMGQAQQWAKTHLGATKTATRTSTTTRMARAAGRRTTGPAGRRSRSR